MNADNSGNLASEPAVVLLVQDLAPIGSVTYERRLNGFALFEDDVMFGFVEDDNTLYLRTSLRTAEQFHSLGAHKHPEMPYWSLPRAAASDVRLLRDLAYEAADNAHLAASFGIDDEPVTAAEAAALRVFGRSVVALAVLTTVPIAA